MNKLVVCIMGAVNDKTEKFLNMCIPSVRDADAIVLCVGDNEYLYPGDFEDYMDCNILKEYNFATNQYAKEYPDKFNHIIISNPYNQEDKGMNGKQRNFYLNYLKENYPNDWALCLDADEVVDDIDKIKQFIQTAEDGIYSVKMRHFQQDLGHEDATQENHWVLNRLFKISEAVGYPEVEHPVLQAKDNTYYKTDCTTIWHLAYIPNLWEIKKRYENHLKKSNMHTPEFLKWWYHNHLFGSYPKKEIKKEDIPEIILRNFGIDKDEIYFANRTIDMKHPLMVQQWASHFKPKSVLDLGCGRGPYLYFWKWFVNNIKGIELSEWAVRNAFTQEVSQGDISDDSLHYYIMNQWDLITAIDVCEHLTDEQLDKTLKNMAKFGKQFLFSIPFIGDPNLTNDKTHLQFKTKDKWKELISSHGIVVEDAPKEWYFSHQLLIGKKKDI